MKYRTLGCTLAVLALGAAASPAFAQSGGECTVTNFNRDTNSFTVANASPNDLNQQCFLTVVPKDQGAVGALVEGNYAITLSGGGGGGGGGGLDGNGQRGADAATTTTNAYLAPGMYRLTIGTGGAGGKGCTAESGGAHGWPGNPTSLSNAHTEQHIAGYQRAEYWVAMAPGIAPSASIGASAPRRTSATGSASAGAGVPRAAAPEQGDPKPNTVKPKESACADGQPGGPGFISLRPA